MQLTLYVWSIYGPLIPKKLLTDNDLKKGQIGKRGLLFDIALKI